MIANAVPNVDYAARQLAEHAENVVEKSRADIEAMVTAAQDRNAVIESSSLLAIQPAEHNREP